MDQGMKIHEELLTRIEELEGRIIEYEQFINAIKTGEVDAFAVTRNGQQEVFTMQSVDFSYRVLIEQFGEGALTLTEQGLIVYTNDHFPSMLGLSYEQVIGQSFLNFISEETKAVFGHLLKSSLKGKCKGEIRLSANGHSIPVYISLTSLEPKLSIIGVILTTI